MYSYNITCKEETLGLLSFLMRIKQFIKVFISRAWSSILQFGGKKNTQTNTLHLHSFIKWKYNHTRSTHCSALLKMLIDDPFHANGWNKLEDELTNESQEDSICVCYTVECFPISGDRGGRCAFTGNRYAHSKNILHHINTEHVCMIHACDTRGSRTLSLWSEISEWYLSEKVNYWILSTKATKRSREQRRHLRLTATVTLGVNLQPHNLQGHFSIAEERNPGGGGLNKSLSCISHTLQHRNIVSGSVFTQSWPGGKQSLSFYC